MKTEETINCDQKTENGDSKPCCRYGRILPCVRLKDWLRIIMEGVALFVAIMVLVETNRQTELMSGEIKHSAETDKQQLRAWVGVTEAKFEPIKAGERMSAGVKIKNSGQTHANEVRMDARFDKRKAGEDKYTVIDRQEGDYGTIAPGADRNIIKNDGPAPTAEEISLMNHGELTYFYAGIVQYTDIFAVSHTTEFCIRYNAKTQTAEFHDQNNAAD